MLGLKRGTVKLMPHHKGWSSAFEREKKRIIKKLGNAFVDIQHIGSTAIPGIHAKPIIDISAGVTSIKGARRLRKPLADLGYTFHRTFRNYIFFAKGPDAKRTHYLHVMRYNGPKWRTDMLFREYLLTHPARARAYSRLKKKLAQQYAADRNKYTAGKDAFIKETLRRAKHI